ncbi:hypothetical protein V8C43DRAFT_305789 [Trichoderma afarasin]
MPPDIPRPRLLRGVRKQRAYSPYPDSSDERPSVPATSIENKMRQPETKNRKIALKEMDNTYEELEDIFVHPRPAVKKRPIEKTAASNSQRFVSSEAEASNPYSDQYPVSRQVFDLEKRAQELQDKRDYFQNQCNELTLIVERLNKATKKERSDHEAKCASLKASNDDMAKQLEEEKVKVKELQSKNESLVKDLAAASERKDFLNKMLEEKTYESWIFRCALAVVFKSTPSTRERVSMRKLICDCFAALKQKYQQDRALQQGDQAEEESISLSDTGDLYSDSEETPLREIAAKKKRPRVAEEKDSRISSDDSEEKPLKKKAAQKKRAREPEKKDNRVSKEDSDDQPLFSVLKKRAKKLKITSRSESPPFDCETLC